MSAPLPPRASMPRSSFAIAMKDYTFIRPGIAVTISAATLVAALIIGVMLIKSLAGASAAVNRGATASEALHRLNAKYEVWRIMATGGDTTYRRQANGLRDTLQSDLSRFGSTLASDQDRTFIQEILGGLANTDSLATKNAREAMIVLLAHQDGILFDAAKTSQQGVVFAAVLLALTILAAGMMIVPMAWLYVRFKRGGTIEVKV